MASGISVVIAAILIAAIAIITAASAYGWVLPRLAETAEATEAQAVRGALAACNDKIVETARTGSASRCYIPADRGRLTAAADGLYYSLGTAAHVCDPTPDWVAIEPAKHIELACNVTAGRYLYQLRWRWPKEIRIEGWNFAGSVSSATSTVALDFGTPPVPFRTLTVYVVLQYVPGAAGKNIDVTRINMTAENVTMGVNIYG